MSSTNASVLMFALNREEESVILFKKNSSIWQEFSSDWSVPVADIDRPAVSYGNAAHSKLRDVAGIEAGREKWNVLGKFNRTFKTWNVYGPSTSVDRIIYVVYTIIDPKYIPFESFGSPLGISKMFNVNNLPENIDKTCNWLIHLLFDSAMVEFDFHIEHKS